jgi:hypothetical protein
MIDVGRLYTSVGRATGYRSGGMIPRSASLLSSAQRSHRPGSPLSLLSSVFPR